MVSLLPYDASYTCKLIRRDLKSLKIRAKNNIRRHAEKLEKAFRKSKTPVKDVRTFNNTSTSSPFTTSDDFVMGDSRPHTPFSYRDIVLDDEQSSYEMTPSFNSPTTDLTPVTSTRLGTATTATAITTVTSHITDSTEHISSPLSQHKNLYEYLDAQLKEWFKTRCRDISHEERWTLRGIYLVLTIALTSCPSNPIYNILRNGYPNPSEADFVLKILDFRMQNNDHTIPTACGISTNRVSQMPVDPYTNKRNSDHIRYDSVLSSASGAFGQDASSREPPPPTQLWYAFLVALTDKSKTTLLTESFLHLVLPETNAAEFLLRVGDPKQRIKDEESDLLRAKFRQLFFPEYKAL